MRVVFICALVLISLIANAYAAPPRGNPGVGIVWIGGIGSEPIGQGFMVNNSLTQGPGLIVRKLRDESYLVEVPDICWSRYRNFDRTLLECAHDVDYAIQKMRFLKLKNIFIGGQELGANLAIAYAASHPDLAGVIAYLPRFDPTRANADAEMNKSIDRAKQLVADGSGDSLGNFAYYFDNIRGANSTSVETTPNIYLSIFGPSSFLNMAENATKLAMPLLWVESTWVYDSHDPFTIPLGSEYAFDKAPKNPRSSFRTFQTFKAGDEENFITEWVRGIGG